MEDNQEVVGRGAPKGNNNANKNKPFHDALRRAIAQDNKGRIRQAAETLLDLAAAGEAWAMKELIDRMDGKAVQATTIANEDGSPILSGITVKFINENNDRENS